MLGARCAPERSKNRRSSDLNTCLWPGWSSFAVTCFWINGYLPFGDGDCYLALASVCWLGFVGQVHAFDRRKFRREAARESPHNVNGGAGGNLPLLIPACQLTPHDRHLRPTAGGSHADVMAFSQSHGPYCWRRCSIQRSRHSR